MTKIRRASKPCSSHISARSSARLTSHPDYITMISDCSEKPGCLQQDTERHDKRSVTPACGHELIVLVVFYLNSYFDLLPVSLLHNFVLKFIQLSHIITWK